MQSNADIKIGQITPHGKQTYNEGKLLVLYITLLPLANSHGVNEAPYSHSVFVIPPYLAVFKSAALTLTFQWRIMYTRMHVCLKPRALPVWQGSGAFPV